MPLKMSLTLIAVVSSFFINMTTHAKAPDKGNLELKLAPKSELKRFMNPNKVMPAPGDVTFSYETRQYRLLRNSDDTLQAQNLATGKVGVIPGIIIVKLKKSADVSKFVRQLNFQVTSVAPQINRVFLKIKNLQNPNADLMELNKYPEIEKSEIEVIESKVSIK